MTVNREAVQHQIYTQVLTSDQQAKAEQFRTAGRSVALTSTLQKMATGTDTAPAPPEN